MNMADALRHARRAERVAPDGADQADRRVLATRVYIEAIKDDRLDDDGLRRSLALEDRSLSRARKIRPSLYGGSLDMLFGRLDQARSSMLDLLAGIAESGEDPSGSYCSTPSPSSNSCGATAPRRATASTQRIERQSSWGV